MNKEDFPILQTEKNGKKLVYLDSAASSQVPKQVIQAMTNYLETSHANIHRGVYDLSQKSTELYEDAHKSVAKFINAKSWKEIIFTRNATESLNIVANILSSTLQPGDEILLTVLEHHSNIVPWQQVAKKTGAVIKWIPLDENKNLDLKKAAELITEKTKIVSFTHVSNVLGVVTPVKELITLANDVGAMTVLDACQSIPSMAVDVQDLDVDFLVFSGHKMCAPTGIGVLYGRKWLLESLPPFLTGGDMIRTVTKEDSTWNELPWKYEAGTPNILGAVGLRAAIGYLQAIDMEKIKEHKQDLTNYLYEKLSKVEGITLHSPKNSLGVVSFSDNGIHPHDVATILNDHNVAIRAGHHCAQPLMVDLGVFATARASVHLYNDKEDVDKLVEALARVEEVLL